MVVSADKIGKILLLQLLLIAWLLSAFTGNTHAQLSLSGVEPPIRDNILAYLRLDDEPCDAPQWRLRRLFAGSEKEIRRALEVVGYYNAEIDKKFEIADACWQASFVIDPGKPVLLRNVSIQINTGMVQDSQLQSVIAKCGLNPGDSLNHAAYDACRNRITRTAEKRGYFASSFSKRTIDIYPDQLAADIILNFDSGPRYVFGEVTFDQAVLDPDMIQRFVTITPGQPYDATQLRNMQRDIIASAYFDQVILNRNPRNEPYYDVPLQFKLTPGKKYQYSAGVGYATDVGPRLRLGLLNRRINTRGHQFEFETNLSQVISDVGITYRIPMDKPKDWFTIDAGYKLEDNDSFKSKLISSGVQRLYKLDNGWIRALFLDLRLEDYETGSFDDDYSKLLTPGISYTFVEEDFPPRPLSGHRSTAQLIGAHDGLVSDTSFLQVYGNTKWVFGLWSGARLLTRAEAGFTGIDELETLPASVRFYAGGDTSVRGYAYKSLGPTDPLGAVVGGQNLLVGSVEIDQQIADDWSLAAFVDSGNAYDRLSEFDTATGVGLGVRWFSPLGPVRVDVAVPLEHDAPDDYRIHVTLGPDL